MGRGRDSQTDALAMGGEGSRPAAEIPPSFRPSPDAGEWSEWTRGNNGKVKGSPWGPLPKWPAFPSSLQVLYVSFTLSYLWPSQSAPTIRATSVRMGVAALKGIQT